MCIYKKTPRSIQSKRTSISNLYCADENDEHKVAYTASDWFVRPIIIIAFSCKNVPICFGKVPCKSNGCIIGYGWLIAIYLFISLVRNAKFSVIENSCVREELSDPPFFFQTQLQKITVEEHIVGEFALTTLTFGQCTSPTENFPFN